MANKGRVQGVALAAASILGQWFVNLIPPGSEIAVRLILGSALLTALVIAVRPKWATLHLWGKRRPSLPRHKQRAASITCKPAVIGEPLRVVLEITNHGLSDEFQGQVVEWGQGNDLSRMPVASLRWVKGKVERITIASGMTEQLEVATLEPGIPDPHLVNSDGLRARGIVSVLVDWDPRGSLVDAAYWKAEDFETRLWSLHIVVSCSKCTTPHHQGVRLRLFGNAADAPPSSRLSAAGWVLASPKLGMTLYDFTPSTPGTLVIPDQETA